MATLTSFISILPKTALTTVGLCVLGSLAVGILMRFFVKPVFRKMDAYIKATHTGDNDKTIGIYGMIKASVYTIIALIATGFVLAKLMNVCVFPADNSKALAFIYFIPMAWLQMFFDKHLERIACRFFGIELPAVEAPEEEEPVQPKPKKVKIFTKKIRYTIDEEGNEVPVEA